ncbi:MAG TPA: hypothetical protein P5293_01040 [Bacteroidales bacterium]|nr:hypothetical protein [Bacteroidales bacterium]
MFYKISELKRNTNIGIILGTAKSVNNISQTEWDEINKCDNLGINNWFYHPTFIPKMCSLELKSYDWQISKDRIAEKWDKGWKNVKWIISEKKHEYISGAIGHENEAQIYLYDFEIRDQKLHPKFVKNHKYNADFNPDVGPLVKSYDASLTTLVHLMYRLGYKYIILYGVDWTHSYYFWSSGDEIYGKTHCKTNKDHEGKDPKLPHNTEHVIDYIIDFNERHMKPQGREILVGYKETRLYPHLNYIDVVNKEIHSRK